MCEQSARNKASAGQIVTLLSEVYFLCDEACILSSEGQTVGPFVDVHAEFLARCIRLTGLAYGNFVARRGGTGVQRSSRRSAR
eukprot:1037275-Lingulodinium_polyedra.AAC.1